MTYDVIVEATYTDRLSWLNMSGNAHGWDGRTGVLEMPDVMFAPDFAFIEVPGLEEPTEGVAIIEYMKDTTSQTIGAT